MSGDRVLELVTDDVRVAIAPEHGGRLTSLLVGGDELLVARTDDELRWGAYPMVPWAGRVNRGRFTFEGVDYQLPITLGHHAIHGTAHRSVWDESGEGATTLQLGLGWPFGGRVEHSARLFADRVVLELRVIAGEQAMPAMAGWHPWFRRRLEPDGAEAELDFEAHSMYELEDEIPTGNLIRPTDGPWDNCFVDLVADPVITWPGRLRLTLSSSCRHWVVFTEPEDALCVEPQTDAPDSFNRRPDVLQPGETLTATFTLAWERLS